MAWDGVNALIRVAEAIDKVRLQCGVLGVMNDC